jgi:hypothetical protein
VTTTSAAPESDLAELPRPARPASVELAAAILIVGGAMNLLTGLASFASIPTGAEAFFAGALALAVGSIVVGVLVRLGRAWLLAVNYAAVLGFIDLIGAGGSPLSLTLGLAEILVVGVLLARKPWFDAMGRWRADQPLTPPTASPPTR